MKKPVRLKWGDVWYCRRLGHRRILWTSRYFICYVTSINTKHICRVRTFRRWVYSNKARRMQRMRRRELLLVRQ
jgi:hypothetical protein